MLSLSLTIEYCTVCTGYH